MIYDLANPLVSGLVRALVNGDAPGVDYDADADTLFAAMSVQPSAARKTLINDLILGLKTDGIWTKLDLFYITAAHDAQAARLNWKGPTGSFNLTAVNSPTFTVDRGYAGDAATSYLDTNYTPSTDGVTYLQDSAHVGAYMRTAPTTGAVRVVLGGSGTGFFVTIAKDSADGDFAALRMNDATSGSTTGQTLFPGHSIFRRSASNAREAFSNAVSKFSSATASNGRPTNKIFLLARTNTSTGNPEFFSDGELSCAHVGGSLDNTEITNITSRVNTYLVAVGAA